MTNNLNKVSARQMSSSDCFVCGAANNLGFRAQFYEMDNGELISLVKPKFEYQSYPERLHGGIAATLLDETMGRAIMINNPDTWGVTIDMETKFIKPVPLNQTLRVIGYITSDRRIFTAEGRILLEDGTEAVTAKARYLKMPVNKISEGVNNTSDILFMTDEEKDIDYISSEGELIIKYKE